MMAMYAFFILTEFVHFRAEKKKLDEKSKLG